MWILNEPNKNILLPGIRGKVNNKNVPELK
jgi:hypothetical protein